MPDLGNITPNSLLIISQRARGPNATCQGDNQIQFAGLFRLPRYSGIRRDALLAIGAQEQSMGVVKQIETDG
jgi:hypothetical protein